MFRNQDFRLREKLRKSVMLFRLSGKLFQSLTVFQEYADWANEELLLGILQSPLEVDLEDLIVSAERGCTKFFNGEGQHCLLSFESAGC